MRKQRHAKTSNVPGYGPHLLAPVARLLALGLLLLHDEVGVCLRHLAIRSLGNNRLLVYERNPEIGVWGLGFTVQGLRLKVKSLHV